MARLYIIMPTYSYICDSCSFDFELFFYIKDYNEHPKCPNCEKNTTERNYGIDMLTLNSSVRKSDAELKTLGDLANRNRDKLSTDEKVALHQKHNSYREEGVQKELPKGMSRIKKPPKPKWTT
jgi:putative FmdB family regulatory protein